MIYLRVTREKNKKNIATVFKYKKKITFLIKIIKLKII